MNVTEHEPTTLFDLDSKELSAYWVDPNQPLIIPRNPLHWRAHELQILLQILKKQAAKNPAQFNSKNYIEALNEYTKAVGAINDGKTNVNEVLDEESLGSDRDTGTAPEMGVRVAPSVDIGVSADNPISG